MRYKLAYTSAFKKGLKRCKKQGLDLSVMDEVVELLMDGKKLPEKNHDHPLRGKWNGFRECHIQPDWLLIYLIEDDVLTLTLVETGSHADLLKI